MVRHKTDWAKFGREVGAMVSFLVTAISLALDSQSILSQVRWTWIALIAFVVFCFLIWRWISDLDTKLNSVTPNIQIAGDPAVNNVNIGHYTPTGEYVLSHVCALASIPFANNPTFRTKFNHAKNVRAEIDFLDEHKNPLISGVQGRWQGLQPNEINTSDRTALESKDIPNNGALRWLDLVMKYPEDEYCYGYNNDSYGQGYFQNPNLLVTQKRFFIHVRLKGEYIHENVFELEVATKGKGDTFEIRHGKTWLRLRNSMATKTPKLQAEKTQKKKPSQKRTSSKR